MQLPAIRATNAAHIMRKTEQQGSDERSDFIAMMRPRVRDIREICIGAADDLDSITAYRAQMMACAMDLRSSATGAGHDLVKEISGSLLDFLLNVAPQTRLHLDLIRAHVDAIMLLMGRYDERQMAEQGNTLAGGLNLAAKRVRRKTDADLQQNEPVLGRTSPHVGHLSLVNRRVEAGTSGAAWNS